MDGIYKVAFLLPICTVRITLNVSRSIIFNINNEMGSPVGYSPIKSAGVLVRSFDKKP